MIDNQSDINLKKALGAYEWSEEETAEFPLGTTFTAVYDKGYYEGGGADAEYVEVAGEWDMFMVTERGWIARSGLVYDYYQIIPRTITQVHPPIEF